MQSTTMFGKTTTTTQSTFVNGGKIQFQGIKTIYPIGERIPCFFTVPEVCKPESGDFIGIYPVGWSSIVRDCIVRQVVPYEQLIAGGQYGQVEFDSSIIMPHFVHHEKQFEFVYVANNGEYTILGKSMPFRFFLTNGVESINNTNTINTPFLVGGKYMPTTPVCVGGEYYPQQPFFGGRMMPVAVESEMQKLQGELVNLEGCWSTGEYVNKPFGVQQQTTIYTQQQQQQQTGVNGIWQPRMVKNVEQILREKIRVEQAHRRVEQLCVLAQLKSCERHIVSVQKREVEIREFLIRSKLQSKIAIFEQKVQQVIGQIGNTTTTPVEQYVRKYEQLLKEKIQLDMEKKRIVLHKLRLTIRDCERKLRDLQTIDQEHLISFHSMLKGKFEQFNGLFCQTGMRTPIELGKHFEQLMGSFLLEQEKMGMNLIQSQRDLVFLVNEITTKLQELEVVECYSQLRIPRITTSLMFNSHPKLMQIAHLERKIAEQKLKLKLQMLSQAGLMTTGGLTTGGRFFVEQLTRGIWFAPIIEKLRTIQYHLIKVAQPQFYQQQPQQHQQIRFWIEKKLQMVGQLINAFVQFQSEQVVCQSSVFDQVKLRNVLVQLREFRERECIEIPRFFQQEQFSTIFGGVFGQQQVSPLTVVVELCQHLNEIIGEKIVELTQYTQCFEPKFFQMQQQMPFECMFVGAPTWWNMQQQQQQQQITFPHQQFLHFGSSMLELIDIERKLVEMKGLALATVQYMHLDERCVELEQLVRIGGGQQQWSSEQHFGKKFVEKLRTLKSLINEHVEFPSTFLTTGRRSFLTVPEHFFQHQQKYEKLCQLIGELECHLIELPIIPTPFINTPYTTMGGKTVVCGSEYPWTTQTPFIGGEEKTSTVYAIHHRFLKLVQEFQMQFPECFAPKCEEIISFLRQWNNMRLPTQTTVTGVFGQQQEQYLREKLVEFETILCQPECEIACLTTVIFPQSTTSTFKTQRECLKFLIRQVRELKTVLCQWTPLNGNNTVNNTTIINNTTGGLYYPVGCEQQMTPFVCGGENKLVDMWTKKMWSTVECKEQMINKPTPTPFGGMTVRPTISMDKVFVGTCGEEMPVPVVSMPRFVRDQQYECVVNGEESNECDFDINNNGEWEKEIDFLAGGEMYPSMSIESCLCKIEKHIRKFNKKTVVGGLLVESQEQPEQFYNNEICPLCTVVDTTCQTPITGMRRF